MHNFERLSTSVRYLSLSVSRSKLKNEVWLDDLEEDQTRAVSVPVLVSPLMGEDQLKCRVDLASLWERSTEKRSTSHWLQVRLFPSSQSLKAQLPNGASIPQSATEDVEPANASRYHFHRLPNPYIFDRPLGSLPQDAFLFEG